MVLSALWFGLSVTMCCIFARPVGRLLGVIDYPDGGRKSHARPTPLVGGMALMVPLLVVALVYVWVEQAAGIFLTLFLAGAGFLLLGWYDDRQHAYPGARLVISTGLFGALLLLQPDLLLTEIDLGAHLPVIPLWLGALPFTVLCLVGFQNAANMVDGMNGLLIGLGIFWTLCLLLYAPDHLLPVLGFLLLGLIILLPFNLSTVLFLGDAGSYSIGAIVGILMLYTHQQADGALPTLMVVVWLFIPVFDCLRVMATRLWYDRSPLAADENHLHHRLARQWRWPVCLVVYLLVTAGPGLIAAIWPKATLAMLAVEAAAYFGLLLVTRTRRLARPQGSPELI